MTGTLTVLRTGPGVTVQDGGRPGWLEYGVSRGGAADRLALAEGAALLGQGADLAAVEMPGMGGEFQADSDLRIALTGAPMRASIDSAAVAWNASHLLPAGARLMIGAARSGSYGYLHVGGGIQTPEHLGARSAHLAAGIGAPLKEGDVLDTGPDSGGITGLGLAPENRFEGGTVRVVASLQTSLFPQAELMRFEQTAFRRGARGNRMGVPMESDGEGFRPNGARTVVSEVIVPGDIQVTGDGTPYVLLAESQTTGGYPRIGTVLPCDLPVLAQAAVGAELRFRFIAMEEAVALERAEAERREGLRSQCYPLIRDPRSMSNLLSFQLISGVIAGEEDVL
ncbi:MULTISPECIES: biotin-dependent carboxyltransferase family protein [unclassified Leisingera]|uniref:5-oxoprolinase subunit C family protein n=1 Tax=unclassified Leisingera TaxID=2614906 RepID=UPI0002E835A7|nr:MULTISPECIES: urea amidolyase [unclassified Leisingera]KIC22999.1 urea amidolyase [Leisingera sp. ANG-S3]KIC25851.1 urea amidolyase [Leisingera sp. ANG-M6]KIC52421.1 urea amidolyase [Leisingera sp. ANG-S]KID07438.1 urea amidolyase [Leisingera sp. ANG1]